MSFLVSLKLFAQIYFYAGLLR